MHYIFYTLLATLFTNCSANKNSVTLNEERSVYVIGKKKFNWTDSSRTDPYYGGYRIINIQVWYPIDQTNAPAITSSEYISDIKTIWPKLNNWTKQNYDAVASVKTASCPGQPISKKNKTYPLLIFSPSLGSHVSYYTYYAEKMAEKGAIVVGISHLYESEFVVDETNKVYPVKLNYHDSLEQLQIPEQITADKFREQKSVRMKILGEDIVFCLNQLEKINKQQFDNRINLKKIGAWGHSIGGAAVIYASLMDKRILSVVNMDGTPPSVAQYNGMDVPFMYMEDLTNYKNHAGYKIQYDMRNEFCNKVRANACRVLMKGINHNSFLDIQYFTAKDESARQNKRKQLDMFLGYLNAFFEHTLNNKPIGLSAVETDTLEIKVFKFLKIKGKG